MRPMIEYKQPALVDELRRRIADGIYSGTLPTTLELAAEFDVVCEMTMGLPQVWKGELPRA